MNTPSAPSHPPRSPGDIPTAPPHLPPATATAARPSAPTGPPVFPPPGPPLAPQPAKRRRWPIVTVVVVASIALVSTIGVILNVGDNDRSADDETSMTSYGPVAPDTIEAKFEIDDGLVLGEFGRVIRSRRSDEPIVQYDENGDERWSTEIPTDLGFAGVHKPVGDLIPVEFWGDGAYPDVYIRFVDSDTGEFTDTEIRLPGDEDPTIYSFADRLYAWYDAKVELYDPASGELEATVIGDGPAFGYFEAAIFVLEGDLVSAYDLDLRPIVTGVQIEHAESLMFGRRAPWQIVDEAIVTVDGDRIVGKDGSGEAWAVELGLGDLGGVRAVGDDSWFVRLPDETSVIVSVGTGDEVTELWRGSEVHSVDPIGSGRILLGFADRTVLLHTDGAEVSEAELPKSTNGPYRTLNNGILFDRDNGDRVDVIFVDLEGNERWTLDTASGWQSLRILDNAIFHPETGILYGPE